jgi:subtilisin
MRVNISFAHELSAEDLDDIVARLLDAGRERPERGPPVMQSRERRYLTLEDLDGTAPPPDVPFYLAPTRTLSIEATGLEVVRRIVRDLATDAVIEEAATLRAIGSAPPFADRIPRRTGQKCFDAGGGKPQQVPWGVERIGSPDAWASGCRGAQVRVAVIDTGVALHEDLPPAVAGQSLVWGTHHTDDEIRHGTHVAGIILARDSQTGVVGVAPKAELISVKVLDENGEGRDDWIAAGILWAIGQGATVLNLSFGGEAITDVLRHAIEIAHSRAVICAAAGNTRGETPLYPASDPNCLSVGSTDRSDARCPHSAVGVKIDLVAPGSALPSTKPGGYSRVTGTSYAVGHVSGAAALAIGCRELSPPAIGELLKANATHLGDAAEFGSGLVQVGFL